MIDNAEVEDSIRFPSAGGLGRGKKGGFTVEKNVVGSEEYKAKKFTFQYTCSHPDDKNPENKKRERLPCNTVTLYTSWVLIKASSAL
ncbi:hypothetical protein UL82_03195 [Corynebacterium kutscheri]|uniref:Secreted LPxTG protein n=1 Tax=Corynebacterium kutscheri TaxID=35755 RepID=A0A0F6R185_9CORY|nr:hypothetical protein UL82_03195 [Corynebacterium kutscheri]VEH06588.1 putative secreted LPxTG protein [Corynebacterium kutscheri]VEH09150.1 putative secreted LPxTG protein [Corynebacterium kutscheri]